MNSTDHFSNKKKQDLIQIAVTFGVLTELKASRMSKQELLQFLINREKDAQVSPVSEKKEPKAKKVKATTATSPSSPVTDAPATADTPPEKKRQGRRPKVQKDNTNQLQFSDLETASASTMDTQITIEETPSEISEPTPVVIPVEAPVVTPAVEKEDASSQATTAIKESKPFQKKTTPSTEQASSESKYPAKPRGRKPKSPKAKETETAEVIAKEPELPKEPTSAIPEPVAPTPVEKEHEEKAPHTAGRTRHKTRSIIPRVPVESSNQKIEKKYDKIHEKGQTSNEEDAEELNTDTDIAQEAEMQEPEPPPEIVSGVLEVNQEGTYGFLRRENYLQGPNDLFISSQYIRRFGLRNGDLVTGPMRLKRETDRYHAVQYITEVNGMPPEKMQKRVNFDRLTAIYPNERFILEVDKNELSTRIIDLVAPIGKGQRGMIVSPPKAGKTILLQKIANSISANNPDAKLIVLLIDERPEEVTDMQRSINGEVVYSTFDKTPENHVRIVELVLERAMRLVELGQDVVILLDSITRLSRAYNLTINPTGRTLSGGLDPGALYGPKRFFGAARNIENGGSLTIVATALIETGSRMDEVIFEEFKGTGNMEVYLDRKLSEKRIFPAIDINKSGTRREDLLLSSTELDAVWSIRKAMSQLDTSQVTEMIISLLLKTKTNHQFVQSMNVSFSDKALYEAMRGMPKGNGNNSSGSMGGGSGGNYSYRQP